MRSSFRVASNVGCGSCKVRQSVTNPRHEREPSRAKLAGNGAAENVDAIGIGLVHASRRRSFYVRLPNRQAARCVNQTVVNPYQPPMQRSRQSFRVERPRSTLRWALAGMCLGATPPVGLGCYGIYQFNHYVASLPAGSSVCGMPMLGSIFLIFLVGPTCGFIGGGAGWIMAAIAGRCSR